MNSITTSSIFDLNKKMHPRTKFYGPNEPKYGPIKALNLHRDPKGDQRWTKQPERKKIRLNFRLSTSTVEHKRSPIF